MINKQRIYIFDTTLRDGQQSPGAGMSFEDNILYAKHAAELGIDILEAGFPAASEYDFNIVNTICREISTDSSDMKVAALCQLREAQIMRTMDALQPCLGNKKARLHTYLPVDPYLMHASLGELAHDKQRIINDLANFIKIAVDQGFEVEFSPEGYSRIQDNFDFTTDVIRAAVSAGASVINCPDTIGGASRWQGNDYFVNHMQQHAEIMAREFPDKNIIWSVHCHNDLGLALDNSITAVLAGPARQIEGCINGVGERAGNVALEQVSIFFEQYGRQKDCTFYTHINLHKLKTVSDFVAEKMLPRQHHWPITGDNAACHTSGGHTNAILQNPLAYQPFEPIKVGSNISFVFGPLSGSNHARDVLRKHGYICTDEEKTAITQAIKNIYATRRKGITDLELIDGYKQHRAPIQIHSIEQSESADTDIVLQLKGQFFTLQDICIKGRNTENLITELHKQVQKYFPHVQLVQQQTLPTTDEYNSNHPQCIVRTTVIVDNHQSYVKHAISDSMQTALINSYINAINQAHTDTYYRAKELQYA
ncbi:MAG: LeuA family protein [Gammaproteobacteria bacterium]